MLLKYGTINLLSVTKGMMMVAFTALQEEFLPNLNFKNLKKNIDSNSDIRK